MLTRILAALLLVAGTSVAGDLPEWCHDCQPPDCECLLIDGAGDGYAELVIVSEPDGSYRLREGDLLGCTDRIAQLEARVAELERQLNASQQWRAVIDPPRDWPYPGARYAIIDVPVVQYQDALWRGEIMP